MRIDHVVIHVTDFGRSNAFYRDVLRAEILEIDGRIAYRIGDQQLNVHGPGVRPVLVARTPVAPGNRDLCFEWPGPIADALRHLERRGVVIEAGPMARGGAKGRGTSVYFRDPDGSLVELISYRDTRVDPTSDSRICGCSQRPEHTAGHERRAALGTSVTQRAPLASTRERQNEGVRLAVFVWGWRLLSVVIGLVFGWLLMTGRLTDN